MSFRLVTGRAGHDHVTSDDMGMLFALTKGDGRYRLDDISCTAIDANTLHVSGGHLLIDGRHFRNAPEGTNLAIASGAQGVSRIDLVVAHYEYRDTGGDYVEVGTLAVIQGEPREGDPEVPAHEEGSILAGDSSLDVPLFTVPITGISVGDPSACLLDRYELPVGRGGTGVATAAEERARLGLGSTTGPVPVASGGTASGTAAGARSNLDAARSNGATNTLYSAEQAIAANASAISALRSSVTMASDIANITFSHWNNMRWIAFYFSDGSTERLVSDNTGVAWQTRADGETEWTERWKVTPSTSTAAPALSNTSAGTCTVAKCGNVVTVSLVGVKPSAALADGASVTLATLAAAYRPRANAYVLATSSASSAMGKCRFGITTGGALTLLNMSGQSQPNSVTYTATITYVV